MKSPNQQYYWSVPIQNFFLFSILFIFLLTINACTSGKKTQTQTSKNSRSQTTSYPPSNQQSKGVVIVPPYNQPVPPKKPLTKEEIAKAREEGLKIARERAAKRGAQTGKTTTQPKNNTNTNKPKPTLPNTPAPPKTTTTNPKLPPKSVINQPPLNPIDSLNIPPIEQPNIPNAIPPVNDPNNIFQPPPPISKPQTQLKPPIKPKPIPQPNAPVYPNTGYTGESVDSGNPANIYPNTGYVGEEPVVPANTEKKTPKVTPKVPKAAPKTPPKAAPKATPKKPATKPKAEPKKPTTQKPDKKTPPAKPEKPTPKKTEPKKPTTKKTPPTTKPTKPEKPKKPAVDSTATTVKKTTTPKTTPTPPAPDPMIPVRPAGVPDEPLNVAVMLPFLNADSPVGPNGQTDFGDKTRLALEFYEGLTLGVEQLKGEGIDINMRVYDTEGDANLVRSYLSDPSMKEADLILGPIYNKPLRAAAQFAKLNRIHVVSPLSPSTTVTAQNPYYLVASPPLETHCAAMYDYIMQHYSSKNIIALTTNDPDDQNIARTFYNIAQKHSLAREGFARNNITQLIFTKDITEEEMEGYLSSYDENIIIAATSNEAAINDAAIKLNTLNKRYSMSLFGMPSWWELREIDLENLSNLNFHVSTPYWMDQYDPYHQQFSAAFAYRYGAKPSQNAAVGFDLMSYFGNLYKDYGQKFGDYLIQDRQEGIYTIYDFRGAAPNQYLPNVDATASPDYLENKFVNILRINRNGQLEKVNF